MFTNVIIIRLNNQAIQLTYMYDNFESYGSGQYKYCFLSSGVSIGGSNYLGLTTGCTNLYQRIFYDNFENYESGKRTYLSLFNGINRVDYLGNDLAISSGIDGLYNFGSLAGTGINSGAAHSSGYLGSGYYFDTNYVTYPHHPSMLLDNFTIEFWAKRNGWLASYARFIDKSYTAGFVVSRQGATDQLNFSILGPEHASINAMPDNSWMHVACVRSGSQCYIYFSGILDNSLACSSAQLTSTSVFAIGQDRSDIPDTESFRGWMDEIRLWNYARSPDQILSGYNRRLEFDEIQRETGLLIYFPFESLPGPVGTIYLRQNYFYDNFERYPSGSGFSNPLNSGVLTIDYVTYSGQTTGLTQIIS